MIATTLAAGSHNARRAMESGQATACALLKLPEPKPFHGGSSELVEAARAASGPRALQLALAVLLAAYEDGTSRDSWRRPTGDTIAYFTALRNWRYPLSDVEQLVLGLSDQTDREASADETANSGATGDQAADADELSGNGTANIDAAGSGEVNRPGEGETA